MLKRNMAKMHSIAIRAFRFFMHTLLSLVDVVDLWMLVP